MYLGVAWGMETVTLNAELLRQTGCAMLHG